MASAPYWAASDRRPAGRRRSWRSWLSAEGEVQADALSELLGETRAAVLRLIDTELTTTALAARANTSPSSVSRHTALLRRGGLITTRRSGTSVIHARTALGTAQVHGH